MKDAGFTLVELMIAMSLLALIGIMSFVAIETAANSAALALAKDRVQSSVRDTMTALISEAELAAKQGDNSLIPPLAGIEIIQNPVPGSPVELCFQVPLDGTRQRWSTPIRFRYMNEDLNGNALLDAGEDKDGDGALTRRIVRIQDINRDGDTSDPGEIQPVGGCNDLSSVEFTLNHDHTILTITLGATARVEGRKPTLVSETVSARVYVCN
ncbi:MAG: PulJ/GspJ family protein [Candidatus Hydrogenedentales bacterium]|jgi:prepilin-type N-terminal cleavage/methylation domain-containing protein